MVSQCLFACGRYRILFYSKVVFLLYYIAFEVMSLFCTKSKCIIFLLDTCHSLAFMVFSGGVRRGMCLAGMVLKCGVTQIMCLVSMRFKVRVT